MRLGTIIKKLQSSLSDEEYKSLFNELEDDPEKVIQMMRSALPLVEVDEVTRHANEAISAIKEGIRSFGSYTYQDKGAREVMDVEYFANTYRSLGAEMTQHILLKICEFKDAEPFCYSVIASLEDLPEEQWDLLMSDSRIADLY
jgi:Ca2+-binding EF-hand superfamily protein